MAEEAVETQKVEAAQNPKKPKKKVSIVGTKTVPVIITLIAAFISCVTSILQQAGFDVFVKRLFYVVLIFLILGTIVKMVLDYAFRTIEEPKTIDDIAAEEEDTSADESSEEGEEGSSSEDDI